VNVSIATMYRTAFRVDARSFSVHVGRATNARLDISSVDVSVTPSAPGFLCLYLASAGAAEWQFPNITGATGYQLTFTSARGSWSTTIANDPTHVGGQITYTLPIGYQVGPSPATATAIWLSHGPSWFGSCPAVTGF